MAKQELCVVTAHEACGSGLFALTLCAPEIAALAQPGQFIHIACGEGNLLRRPISICLAENGALHIVFQVKGSGTEWLAARKEGDALDVLGPLGHGFDVAALGAKPVFLGGGIGVPPMLQTAPRDGAGLVPGATAAAGAVLVQVHRAQGTVQPAQRKSGIFSFEIFHRNSFVWQWRKRAVRRSYLC